jgi:hypothetical protein
MKYNTMAAMPTHLIGAGSNMRIIITTGDNIQPPTFPICPLLMAEITKPITKHRGIHSIISTMANNVNI